MKPQKILVTGIAGFIGSNFANKFHALYPDTTIIGIDNLSSGRLSAVPDFVKFYQDSIVNRNNLSQIFIEHNPEYVFHFAAIPRVTYGVEHPDTTNEANVQGTVEILNQSRLNGVKRVIISSSSSVYGGAKNLPTKESENPPAPISPYALQKYIDEQYCQLFSSLYALDTVCLRYFNVFGPGQYGDSAYSTVISAWLENLYFPKQGKRAFIEGDGSKSRDFCYVDNVVQANIKAMEYEGLLNGDVFNIAHGDRTTINEVRELIEKFSNRKLDLEQRPDRIGDVAHTHADISKAKNIFGYNPEINFEEGMRRTIKWQGERLNKKS